eukprot:Rmarinus@m.13650
MPAVELFGRKWALSTDDFLLPGVLAFSIRLFCVIGIVLEISLLDAGCGGSAHSFYLSGLCFFGVSLLIDAVVIYLSLQGSIIYPGARDHLPKFLYFHLVFMLGELIWVILATRGIVNDSKYICSESTWQSGLFGVVVLLCWGSMAAFLCILPFIWRSELSWVDILMSCTPCLPAAPHLEHESTYETVGRIVNTILGVKDLVLSDIVAGLILLHAYHKRIKRKWPDMSVLGGQSQNGLTCEAPVTNPTSPLLEGLTLGDAHYYSKFMLASYGWPLFVKMQPIKGCKNCCAFVSRGSCCCTAQANFENHRYDNCCRIHQQFLEQLVGDRLEILDACYREAVFLTPYFVAVDHDKRAIVVAARGTLSVQDVVTDGVCECEPVHFGQIEGFGHQGCVMTARGLEKDLEERGILHAAIQNERHTGYQLLFVGHSLGAGVATLLCMMYRDRYPTAKCIAYSPPGGLLSLNLSRACRDFVVSIVLHNDFISRLSVDSAEKLRNELVVVLTRTRRSKWYVFTHARSRDLFFEDMENPNAMDQVHSHSYDAIPLLAGFAPKTGQIAALCHTQLYLPGRLVHMERHAIDTLGLRGSSRERLIPVWKDVKDFTDIVVSKTMWLDHFPDHVCNALEAIVVPQLSPDLQPGIATRIDLSAQDVEAGQGNPDIHDTDDSFV